MDNKKQEIGRNFLQLSSGIFFGAVIVNALSFYLALIVGVVILVVGIILSKSK